MIVTSMIETLEPAMMPPVGPAAQLIPAANVQRTSRARKSRVWETVT